MSAKYDQPACERQMLGCLGFDIFLGLRLPDVTVLNSNDLDDGLYGILCMFPYTALVNSQNSLDNVSQMIVYSIAIHMSIIDLMRAITRQASYQFYSLKALKVIFIKP